MTIEAVIFDWGGTLTPFSSIEMEDMWRLAGRHLAVSKPIAVFDKPIDPEEYIAAVKKVLKKPSRNSFRQMNFLECKKFFLSYMKIFIKIILTIKLSYANAHCN